VGGDWRPAVALRARCVVQRVLNHREEAIHRVLGYAELDPHGLESFSDAAHHHLDCSVGPRAVRRSKMMRSSIDPAQLLSYLVLVVGALIGHPIRDDPKEGEPLLHGGDHVVCATSIVPCQLTEAAGIVHKDMDVASRHAQEITMDQHIWLPCWSLPLCRAAGGRYPGPPPAH
jgi:hypothetical protein